jgi:hypothetical protein
MGIVLWFAAGLAAFLLARLVPLRRPRWFFEIAASVTAGMLAGLVATALDFGGWREIDWRAGAFAFFISLAVLGLARALRR